MLHKVGLYTSLDGEHKVLTYNGKKIDAVFNGNINSFGVYCNGVRLDVDGVGVAKSSSPAAMSAKGENLYLNEVNLLTDGECVNITESDYNALLSGKLVAGYKRYSRSAIYNIVPNVSQAQAVSYTIADGIITFSGGATSSVADNSLYNNAGILDENTLDLTETITNSRCPFVNVRWFDPKIPVGGKIELQYFVDTQTMSSLNEGAIGDTFTVIIKTADGLVAKRTTYAGEFTLETPVFSTEGETWFSVECVDSNGVGSAVQYFDILVRDAVTPNYYTMVAEDLITYGIVTRDDEELISVTDAIANKAALTSFFAAVKQGGYNGVVMLEKIYWIDYHTVNGVGTQTYYRCTVANNKYTSVESVSEQIVVASGEATSSFGDTPPAVGDWSGRPDGTYYLVKNTSSGGGGVVLPDEFTVDLNGATIAATQCTDLLSGTLFHITGFDVHVKNGIVRGNYDGFDFVLASCRQATEAPGEMLATINFRSCRYCSIEGLDVSGALGYELAAGAVSTDDFYDLIFSEGKRVDLDTGETIDASGFVSTQKVNISNALYMGNQPNRYISLGRGGYAGYLNCGTQREVFFSWYDDEDNYIGSTKSRLYFQVSVPDEAKYVKFSCYGHAYSSSNPNDVDWKLSNNGTMKITSTLISRGVAIIDCHWHDTRTTAITNLLAKNMLIDGCTYENISAERGKYGVSSYLGLLEDSWNWCSCIKLNNVSCNKGRGSNVFSIYYARNIEFCRCNGIVVQNLGGVEDGVFEDNNFDGASIAINKMSYHPHVLYRRNSIGSIYVSCNAGPLGNPDDVIAMSDTVIKSKCGYPKLRLINSKNGDTMVER